MMEHLDLASEVLQAFSLWAEQVEPRYFADGLDHPVLRLYPDGSGRICGSRSERVYLHFSDLLDLVHQLDLLTLKRNYNA